MKIYRLVHLIILWMVLCVTANAGNVTYVYTDPQGTPLLEVDANGNITASFDYRPFGSQAMGNPSSGPGYTGHVNDPETNLVYMQARYYDPAVGRFISVDPNPPRAGDDSSFNRFAYATNNPILNTDPDGRESACVSRGNHCGDFAQGPSPAMQRAAASASSAVSDFNDDYVVPLIGANPMIGEEISSGLKGVASVLGAIGDASKAAKAVEVVSKAGDLHAPGDVPDATVVVRGGTAEMPATGTKFSASQGQTVAEAGKGVPHGQLRASTAGEIRANGGHVEVAPEPTRSGQINGQHVNVTEGGKSTTFGSTQPNPAPKPERVQ